MNIFEAFLLLVVFFSAISLTVATFLTTTSGYLAIIETRYKLLEESLESNKKIYPPQDGGSCSTDGKLLFTESGYPVALIRADLGGSEIYYYLVPSPGYVISQRQTSCVKDPRIDCPLTPYLFCNGPVPTATNARAFIVLPNGSVLVTP